VLSCKEHGGPRFGDEMRLRRASPATSASSVCTGRLASNCRSPGLTSGLASERFFSTLRFHARDWLPPCLSCPMRNGTCYDAASNRSVLTPPAFVAKTSTRPRPRSAPPPTPSWKSSCAHDGRITSPSPPPPLTTPTSHTPHAAKTRTRRSCDSSQTPLQMGRRRTRSGCLRQVPVAGSQV
jgi:hypothetical protein